jgi:hypothetical protein
MLQRDSCRQRSETLSEKRESRTPRVYLPSQSQILQLGNKEELEIGTGAAAVSTASARLLTI